MKGVARKWKRQEVRSSLLLVCLLGVGCGLPSNVPTAQDLHTEEGRPRAVVLLRVLLEVDGQREEVFSNFETMFVLRRGDFSTGGRLGDSGQRFLSDESLRDGWTYLLLEPGTHYFGVSDVIIGTYDAIEDERRLKPLWRLELPPGRRVVYGGTLFLAGAGRPLIGGHRSLTELTPERFKVWNESTLAREIHAVYLRDLGPLTTMLVQPQSESQPLVFDTPPGR